MTNYEQPTDELRVIKRPIRQSNGPHGVGCSDRIDGYDTFIQRKWAVEFDHELGFKALRYEWRDIPTIIET
jgi:hypothetical protein